MYGKKEAGTGEHLNTFNNQINKHNRKAAAPHGRLPQTKHKLKSRPGPLSSSTVVTPFVNNNKKDIVLKQFINLEEKQNTHHNCTENITD